MKGRPLKIQYKEMNLQIYLPEALSQMLMTWPVMKAVRINSAKMNLNLKYPNSKCDHKFPL